MSGIVSGDLLQSTLIGVQALWADRFPVLSQGQPWRLGVMELEGGKGKAGVDLSWFGDVPKMSEFKGETELSGLRHDNHRLEHVLYSGGFTVAKQAWERDQLGEIKPKTEQLMAEAARFPGEKFFEKLVAGTTDLAFDGTAFFANTRVIGESANIDNLLGASGTSAANIRTDIGLVRAAMSRFETDKGKIQNLFPNQFWIPPELSGAFYEALNVGTGSDDVAVTPVGENGISVWKARGYTVVEAGFLTDAGDWYAFHVSPGMAPMAYSEEYAARILSDIDPNSRAAIMQKNFAFAAEASFAMGYTDPRLAVKVA